MRKPMCWGILVVFMFAMFASAQTNSSAEVTVKDRYHSIEVGAFDIRPGVEIPADYLASLPQKVAEQLKHSKKFQEVLGAGEKASPEDAPVLQLSGTLTGYDQGNRGARYVGFGMGAARMFMIVKYRDRSSGQLIYEDKVVGTLTGGLFGGNENQVVGELARAVTVTTKIVLLRNLRDASSQTEKESGDNIRAVNLDNPVVDLKGDLSLAENTMNELAAQGYRLADFRVTGNNSAQVTMEKVTSPPQTYHYVLIHALRIGKVQENMNKAAAEGYRLVPHTLTSLHAFAVLMEKLPVAAEMSYEYRFSSSMLQSNAEKHVTKDQQEGFALVQTGKVLNQNVVISEKATPVEEASR